jgi:uncharacterized protein
LEHFNVIIRELIWDDWNQNHINRHDVNPDEVELALSDKYVLFLRAHSGRILVLGRANQRLLAVVMNEQEKAGAFYVITARDMSKKERNYYRLQKGIKDE